MRFHRLHRVGIVRYLTAAQKDDLCRRFQLPDSARLDWLIIHGNDEARKVLRAACETLGIKGYYPHDVDGPIRSGWMRRKNGRGPRKRGGR